MQKWGKRLFCIVFSFIFFFISVGYAQVVDTMTITGATTYKYEGVYISSIEQVSASNLTAGSLATVFPTNVKNTVTLTGNNSTSTVKYKITVTNTSSRYTYVYKGIVCDSTLDGYNNNLYGTTATNSNFVVALTNENGSGFSTGTSIAPESDLVFYATYTFGRRVTKNTEYSFLLNYKFGIHVASMGEMAVEKTLGAFLDVLNTGESYNTLITNIDNKYTNADWQANYIGNVSNTAGNVSGQGKEDAEIVENLIGSGLTLTVDGVTKNVTVLIKREDIDDNTRTGDAYRAVNGSNTTTGVGCEMTIYMTPNDLDKTVDDGEYDVDSWWGRNDWAEVYIAISTCKNDGTINSDGSTNLTSEWYQIGDIYAGIADIVTYDGGTGTGSFVTDHWVSLEKTYKVTGNYSYTITANRTIKSIMQDVDPAANAEFERLLTLANKAVAYVDANRSYFNVEEYRQLVATLREVAAEANEMTVNASTTRSSVIPILKSLENAIYPFQSFINK